jgi:hypothetical protein
VIDITLTDFLNIVQSTGMTKLSKIRKIKIREYSPASDYYKSLREAIVAVLSSGDDATEILPAVYNAHQTRQQNYREIADNFIRWVATKKGWTWVNPPRAYYGNDTIGVKINPELSFVDKSGNMHVIKLHFNKEQISKGKLDVAGCLFSQSLAPTCPANTNFYFLDLHQGRQFSVKNAAGVDVFLNAELEYIKSIWNMA